MKRKIFLKRILPAFFILFALIQLIRPKKNNGAVDPHKDITHFVQMQDTIRNILKASCYDCHSNRTRYPWYAEIAPSSWWLANHVKNGKEKLNFSDFAQYTPRRMKNKLTAISDQIENGEMPLKSYLFLHGYARLSKEQIQLVKNWADSAKAEIDRKR